MSGRSLVGAAIVAATALVALYLVLGGGSYEPTPVADPCAPREWRDPQGVEESAQQFALSALDGAACQLDVYLMVDTSLSGRKRLQRRSSWSIRRRACSR